MKLILEGLIENISTRSDGTIKFTFGTQELDSSQAGNLFQLRGKYTKCFLSDNNISQVEIDLIDNQKLVSRKEKTPSKRLKAVLFIFWEQMKTEIDFDTFYKMEMEKIIEHFKNKLE